MNRQLTTLVLVLFLSCLMAGSVTAAPQREAGQSDWFGGYTISPDWNAGDISASNGCRDIDTWHTGRFTGVIDYKFHLYVHWCWKQDASGFWHFTTIKIRTGINNIGSTANYEGVYEKLNNYYTYTIGSPVQRTQTNACLHIVRKAQITHHLPGVPIVDGLVGHAVVAAVVCADGSPGEGWWPYHNQGQL
jgi:hypothetical protein